MITLSQDFKYHDVPVRCFHSFSHQVDYLFASYAELWLASQIGRCQSLDFSKNWLLLHYWNRDLSLQNLRCQTTVNFFFLRCSGIHSTILLALASFVLQAQVNFLRSFQRIRV